VGLILDTSAIVTAERRGRSVPQILAQVREAWGETEIGLSAVTLAELVHGSQRAKLEAQRQRRNAFVEELMATVTVYPVTAEIARLAGLISGQEAARGVNLPFEDLLIGATALQLGFEVVTEDARHFQMIPNLVVKSL
jgi:predicted nucleic acid-binding protein